MGRCGELPRHHDLGRRARRLPPSSRRPRPQGPHRLRRPCRSPRACRSRWRPRGVPPPSPDVAPCRRPRSPQGAPRLPPGRCGGASSRGSPPSWAGSRGRCGTRRREPPPSRKVTDNVAGAVVNFCLPQPLRAFNSWVPAGQLSGGLGPRPNGRRYRRRPGASRREQVRDRGLSRRRPRREGRPPRGLRPADRSAVGHLPGFSAGVHPCRTREYGILEGFGECCCPARVAALARRRQAEWSGF